jgi:hypothetical protein
VKILLELAAGRYDAEEAERQRQLVSDGISDRSTWPADLARHVRDIESALRRQSSRRSTFLLPEPSVNERRRFLHLIHEIGMLSDSELKVEPDARGKDWWVGRAKRQGQWVEVRLDPGRTSIRPRTQPWACQARIVPRSYVDDRGIETVRYQLTHTTLALSLG